MNEQVVLQDARRCLARRHRRGGILITGVAVSRVVAVLYNYTTRPVHQATAQVLIDRDTPNVLPNKELVDVVQAGADYYQTQYQLLRGRMLAQKVVERLGLQKGAEFQPGPLMTPWEGFQRRFLGRLSAAPLDSDGMSLSPAVAAFRSRVTVEPVPGSRLVNLRFTAYDPALAAQAVNALAQLYIEQSLEFRFTTSTEATGWLGERLKEQQLKAEIAEKSLQQYREKEGLINLEEKQSLVDQKLSALNAAVLNARTERITKETVYNQMRNLGSSLETFPLVLTSPIVQSLKTQLADLQKDQARLSETLGDKHPEMIKVRNQLRATEEKLRNEMHNVVRAAETDYRTAAQQEANLQVSLDVVKHEALEVNRKAIEFGVLKREVESNQQLFKELLNRNKQTGLETELKTTNIRVVEKAEVPRGPISPQRIRNYELAVLIGLALGIGLTVFFEHLDNTLKTPEDVKEHLGLPFLGMVPDVGARPTASGTPRASPLILKNPQSAVAESYRVLRTNLIFSSAATTGRAVVVSSATPGEGKTTTVANLASSLALNGARVLAVDADLRRPTMHQHFGIAKTPGLTDLIVGKCQASQAIQATRLKGLQVLPCGYVPPNPAELLGSPAMKHVVEALKSHYDWVLINTPPILAMADTPVLSPLLPVIILVSPADASTTPTPHP